MPRLRKERIIPAIKPEDNVIATNVSPFKIIFYSI
jgi:hypothetical protein